MRNKNSIFRMALVISIGIIVIMGMDYFVGTKITFYFLSTSLLAMAFLFTFKKEYAIKYYNFMNPSYMEKLELKGEAFKRKNLSVSIYSLYFGAAVVLLNTLNMGSSDRIFTGKSLNETSKFILIIAVIIIISYLLNNFILKKSKSTSSYVILLLILSFVLVIVIFGLVSLMIF